MTRPIGRPIIKLRSAESSDTADKTATTARIIAISSGKGGVGKSSVTLNLAVALAKMNQRVCIFDADTNLANINIMSGLTPQLTLQDVIAGNKQLQDILLTGPQGVSIVPAASGLMELIDMDASKSRSLLDGLRSLEHQFDFILLDTAAGISESVLEFIQAASETIITITTEPTSLTDAFSLLKVLSQRGFNRPFQVVVNRVENFEQAKQVMTRFASAVKKYLNLKIVQPGYMLEDRNVPRSIMHQRPFTLLYPESPASLCMHNFAKRVLQRKVSSNYGLAQFLGEQLNRVAAVETVSASSHEMDAVNELIESIHSAPFDQAEQWVAKINQAWLQRVDSHRAPVRYLQSDGFRAALRFASKLQH